MTKRKKILMGALISLSLVFINFYYLNFYYAKGTEEDYLRGFQFMLSSSFSLLVLLIIIFELFNHKEEIAKKEEDAPIKTQIVDINVSNVSLTYTFFLLFLAFIVTISIIVLNY